MSYSTFNGETGTLKLFVRLSTTELCPLPLSLIRNLRLLIICSNQLLMIYSVNCCRLHYYIMHYAYCPFAKYKILCCLLYTFMLKVVNTWPRTCLVGRFNSNEISSPTFFKSPGNKSTLYPERLTKISWNSIEKILSYSIFNGDSDTM